LASGQGFWGTPVVPAATGADNVVDERVESGMVDGLEDDTEGDVDVVVAARFGHVL
jgi:hypothetical protein